MLWRKRKLITVSISLPMLVLMILALMLAFGMFRSGDDSASNAPERATVRTRGSVHPAMADRICDDMTWAARIGGKCLRMSPEETTRYLLAELDSRCLACCLGSAEFLAARGDAASRTAVEGLLDSPDAVVRRVAADLLFGPASVEAANADRYRYVHVLRTEEEARTLIAAIESGSPAKRPAAARALISLGRGALWPVQKCISSSSDRATRLLAASVQVGMSFDPPEWWKNVRARLDAPFAAPGVALTLDRHLAVVRQHVAVTLSMAERDPTYGDAGPHEPRLGERPHTLGRYVEWICARYDLRHGVVPGGILVGTPVNWDGVVGHLIDVSDLEGADRRLDWYAIVDSASPGGDRRWRLLGEYEETTSYVGGFLYIKARTHQDDPTGSGSLAGVYRHLDRMRRGASGSDRREGEATARGYCDTSLWPGVAILPPPAISGQ
jgi:hypothetical protein